MSRLTTILMGGWLFVVAGVAFAQDETLDWTTVDEIWSNHNSLQFLVTTGDSSLSDCQSGRRFQLDVTNADYASQVASLIAAFMADMEVELIMDGAQFGSPPPCSPKVKNIHVRRP